MWPPCKLYSLQKLESWQAPERCLLLTGKAAGKAKKYVGRISSRLVRNIKGDGLKGDYPWGDLSHLHAHHSNSHIRSRSSFDSGIQEATDGSGEDQADEPLEKVGLTPPGEIKRGAQFAPVWCALHA